MSYDEHLISMAGGDGDSRARLAAIQKSNDMWMKSPHTNRNDRNTAFLLAMVREQRAVIERVRKLHVPVMEDGNPVGCSMCDWEHPEGAPWPCGTLAALTTPGLS